MDPPPYHYQPPTVVSVDVFRLVLACVTRADLLKITLASKFAREEATKEMLKRPVSLLRNHGLRTFCQFALSGDPGKLSCLQNLTIENIDQSFSSQDREMVAHVLAHCTNLRKLDLQGCDVLFMDEPVVPEAVSALPNLAHLSTFTYIYSEESQALLLQMVGNMKSSLRGLHLCMNMDVEVLRDVARAHRHLEDFALQFSTFTAPGLTFSAVRTLHLTLNKNLPQLRDIRSTFPNVHELSIDFHRHLDETHAAGIENEGTGHCWPALDLLCACPTFIRALGIVCPVRRLSPGFCDHNLDEELTASIARLRASKLTLDLRCGPDWVLPGAPPSLLLHGSQDAGVKHLFVKATPAHTRRSPPATQTSLLSWIRPLLHTSRVELLHIAEAKYFESDSDDPQDILDLHAEGSHEGQTASEAVAGELARACASIRTIAITTALSGHTVWSVDRADGEARVVKLGAFEGRRVFDQEAKRCLEV